MADAGWYPDSTNEGGQAYWDGQRWTGDRRPVTSEQQGGWQQGSQQQGSQQQGSWAQQPGAAPVDQTQRIDRGALPPDLQGQHGQQGQQADQGWQQGGQQGAQQGGWQQPQQQGWQQPQWEDPKPRKRSRKPLIIAAAAVVVLAAGLVTWLVWPDNAPTLTYNGKEIASASKTLTAAEKNVKATVAKRHGASGSDTRCYFAQAKKPPKGQKGSDIEQGLRCGPVLFVDGDKSREYLSVPITSKSASGNKVELTPSSSLDDLQPQAVSADLKLNRPDGEKAPSGSGGLSVPKPPPASATQLGIAELGPTAAPKSLGSTAVMVGRDTKVTLKAAGFIDRYGQGDQARSAASGKKLVAFQVDYGEGDVSGSSEARAKLLVTGQAARELPDADSGDWIVASVPDTGAQLQLADGGFTQTLSLPDGKPGSNNIAVLRRTHRTALLIKTFDVPVHLSRSDGATANATLHARTTIAALDFWAQQNTSVHASSPDNALLSLNPLYTISGSSTRYGFDPTLVKLRVPGGHLVSARNIATGGKIYNVFEVPASFTSGVLVISGSEKLGRIKLSVRKAASLPVSISAG